MCAGHHLWTHWWIVPMAFWAVMMIACAWFLARGGFGRWRRRRSFGCWDRGAATPESSPLELLKARYAKGEIGKEEFEEMRRELEA